MTDKPIDNVVDLDSERDERFTRKALPLVLAARRKGFRVRAWMFAALRRAQEEEAER